MNNLLQLKGTFEQKPRSDPKVIYNIPTGKSVNVSKLQELQKNLIELKEYWRNQNLLSGALIAVHYIKIAAKSNRLKILLGMGSTKTNQSVVGAKFSDDASPKHIITHYVSQKILDESIKQLSIGIEVLHQEFNDEITHDTIKQINANEILIKSQKIAKSNFVKIIVDAYYVEKFDISIDDVTLTNDAIITLYKTDVKTIELLEKIGIHILSTRMMDETTILLRPDELEILKTKAPYLIAMAVSDLSEITKDDFESISDGVLSINSPQNEPTIGVIDTLFDKNVYFSEWVEYTNMLSSEIPTSPDDKEHGTAVSSIIVDGPSFNPDLDDGCGRFKVRHFGVASGKSFNSFTILRNISEIVAQNRDIKVWNLSLGSKLDIHPNFISPEAAILDKIQFENDVMFVIAGTNLSHGEIQTRPIGAPADSINSIVVNAVDTYDQPASYSRKGPVLSFYIKPDISYYGGDNTKKMRVCTPTGEAFVQGTSFAAPWISRKMSYLIDILGMSREVAKALLIHSATGWDKEQSELMTKKGHGVVPIKIEDIVLSSDDEIQFILQGVSELYNTYNYKIPVPVVKEKYPYVAKATLCCFPASSRNQGVDYTNTELDIKFGRLKDNSIDPINNNNQTEPLSYILEKDARQLFRKWDNVKHIRRVFTGKNQPLKVHDTPLWGLSLETKERLEEKFGEGLEFGVVITLKEINRVNRIDEFIQNAQFKGWLVNKIDVDARIEIFNKAEEEIEFE